MRQKECIAMILAGGKEAKLGALTGKNLAVPAIYFGGKYRVIDFVLSNCKHSGVDTLGILTQYQYSALHEYVDNGQSWGLDKKDGGTFMLSSAQKGIYYTGTADAVYKNMDFIEHFNPEHVLILSGDHIYKMNYAQMLHFHKKTGASATIAATRVPWEDASRFGIITADEDGLIMDFEEKPAAPQSNFASMGIYIFNWKVLKEFLIADKYNLMSKNDFGKDIIPAMLATGEQMYVCKFAGYWRDVGTLSSFWESNMELLQDMPPINLHDEKWEIITKSRRRPPCCISSMADIKRSIVAEGCKIYGHVKNSVLFDSVTVEKEAEVIDSIIMPGAIINRNARIYKTVVGAGVSVGENAQIGMDKGVQVFYDNKICSKGISMISPGVYIDENIIIAKNSHIDRTLSPHERRELALWQEISINETMAKLELIYV